MTIYSFFFSVQTSFKKKTLTHDEPHKETKPANQYPVSHSSVSLRCLNQRLVRDITFYFFGFIFFNKYLTVLVLCLFFCNFKGSLHRFYFFFHSSSKSII